MCIRDRSRAERGMRRKASSLAFFMAGNWAKAPKVRAKRRYPRASGRKLKLPMRCV